MAGSCLFSDRSDAGRRLAAVVATRDYADPVVLALPRGGIPVAAEIARALGAPLDLLLVRKLGVPFQPELAAGAVVDGDSPETILNDDVVSMAGMGAAEIDRAREEALRELERRRELYLDQQPVYEVADRTAIVVDDGIATGATARAGFHALRRRGAASLVLAIPVAPPETISRLQPELDDIVCLATPEPFFAIGPFYRDFHQMTDDEVIAILNALRHGDPL